MKRKYHKKMKSTKHNKTMNKQKLIKYKKITKS